MLCRITEIAMFFFFNQTIIENDQKLKHDEDKIVLLENRLKNMTHSFGNEKRLMDNLTKVLDVIDSIMARIKENNLTLEESATIFSDLRVIHLYRQMIKLIIVRLVLLIEPVDVICHFCQVFIALCLKYE